MKQILTNPYIWLGGILGVGWYIKNKPTSKVAKVGTTLKTAATSLIDEAGQFATDVVDTGVTAGQEVIGVVQAGDVVADVDASGFDGRSSQHTIEDHDTDAHFSGDANVGVVGVDIKDTDEMVSPDDEGNDGSGFSGDGYMNFNDTNY